MKNWIKLDKDNFIFYIQSNNINAIGIDKEKPLELYIMMVGDEEPTTFTFQSNKLRNEKLDEIFQRKKEEPSNEELA